MSPSPSLRRFCLFLLIFGVFVPRALSASFGVCMPGWEWANNSMNQNPCEIAGALDVQCGPVDSYVLGPLPPDYRPQTNDTVAQKCNCNTVMYSLYQACTGCQNTTIQKWSYWRGYCEQTYVTQYPDIIPPITAVPHWAYLNYTVGDIFDPVLAKAAGGPESLAPIPPTLSVSSTLPSGTANPSATQGSNGGGKKSSSVGAIIGGVAGGLAALALIVIGTRMIFIRKRAVVHAGEDYPDDLKVSTDTPTAEREIPPSYPRLYDPSDPSTYPTHVDYTQSEPYPTAPQSVHYTGVPEL